MTETGIGSGIVNTVAQVFSFIIPIWSKSLKCDVIFHLNERDMHMNCSWSGYFYRKFMSIFSMLRQIQEIFLPIFVFQEASEAKVWWNTQVQVDVFRRKLLCFVSLCFRFKVVASFVEGNIRIEMFLAKCSGDRGFFLKHQRKSAIWKNCRIIYQPWYLVLKTDKLVHWGLFPKIAFPLN